MGKHLLVFDSFGWTPRRHVKFRAPEGFPKTVRSPRGSGRPHLDHLPVPKGVILSRSVAGSLKEGLWGSVPVQSRSEGWVVSGELGL